MASLIAKPWMLKARNRIRRNALARGLYGRWMSMFDYEQRFGTHMLAEITPQTIVWDVGANVGLYTAKFLSRGAAAVVCFEPASAAFDILERNFAARAKVLPLALSDQSGVASFDAEGAAPTNRLSSATQRHSKSTMVKTARADELIESASLDVPSLVKIDVEGFEWEVVRGFGRYLRDSRLRAMFIEIHFALLHERGLDDAPRSIVSALESAGFGVRWVDLSHICALRPR